MIKLGECTYVDAARLARDPRSVILLPLGAVEEHGPHLPLLVDWLGAERGASRLISGAAAGSPCSLPRSRTA